MPSLSTFASAQTHVDEKLSCSPLVCLHNEAMNAIGNGGLQCRFSQEEEQSVCVCVCARAPAKPSYHL